MAASVLNWYGVTTAITPWTCGVSFPSARTLGPAPPQLILLILHPKKPLLVEFNAFFWSLILDIAWTRKQAEPGQAAVNLAKDDFDT